MCKVTDIEGDITKNVCSGLRELFEDHHEAHVASEH